MMKRKKRATSLRDDNAPRFPLTGYVRFLNIRRGQLRLTHPDSSLADITKQLAEEWDQLPLEEKKQYLDAAVVDKERYHKEMLAYKQTEAYREFTEGKTKKKKHPSTDSEENTPVFDIPIFTEEFLAYNRQREADLRSLRKSNTEMEQQNSILEKHLDNMKQAGEKLSLEVEERSKAVSLLKRHLTNLRESFWEKFASFPLPGTSEKPTLLTMDSYVVKMCNLLNKDSEEGQLYFNQVQSIVATMTIPLHPQL